jgi:hypothetical protein
MNTDFDRVLSLVSAAEATRTAPAMMGFIAGAKEPARKPLLTRIQWAQFFYWTAALLYFTGVGMMLAGRTDSATFTMVTAVFHFKAGELNMRKHREGLRCVVQP